MENKYNSKKIDDKLDKPYTAGDYLRDCKKFMETPDLTLTGMDALWNRSFVARNCGKLQEELEISDEILKIEPNHLGALSNKVFALNKLGRHTEALEICEMALKINSSGSTASANKAYTLSKLGRRKEALIIINEILKKDFRDDKYTPEEYLTSLHQLRDVSVSNKLADQGAELDNKWEVSFIVRHSDVE